MVNVNIIPIKIGYSFISCKVQQKNLHTNTEQSQNTLLTGWIDSLVWSPPNKKSAVCPKAQETLLFVWSGNTAPVFNAPSRRSLAHLFLITDDVLSTMGPLLVNDYETSLNTLFSIKFIDWCVDLACDLNQCPSLFTGYPHRNHPPAVTVFTCPDFTYSHMRLQLPGWGWGYKT